MNEENIMKTWRKYFKKLLEENEKKISNIEQQCEQQFMTQHNHVTTYLKTGKVSNGNRGN